MRQLSGLDASFLYGDTLNADTHGTLVMIYDPSTAPDQPVRFKDILAHVEKRLSISRVFRQKLKHVPLDLDYPYWVDDPDFELEYHVRHACLPPPGDDRQLKRLCGRIISQQLDRGKPLWEIWIVEGLEHDRVALLSKVHHCMVDGVSGVDLLQVLLSKTPEKEFDPPSPWYPNETPSAGRLLRDAIVRRVEMPLAAARAVASAVREPELALERARDTASGLVAGARSTHDSRGTVTAARSYAQGNDAIGIAVETTISEPADLWWAPVETVSNSEAGFERVYQGAGILVSWPLSLGPGESRTVTVSSIVTTTRDRADEETAAARELAST